MLHRLIPSSLLLLLALPAARADVLFLQPAKDNTLYQSSGSLSNGSGSHIFTGRTGQSHAFSRRRAVIAFDIAAGVPAGSTINSVTLQLFMSRSPTTSAKLTALFRLEADWGEGTSNDSGGEGSGAPATAGDATWLNTFFPSDFWTNVGGDFAPAPSGVTAVGGNGTYTWSDGQMVADVQDWLDNPGANYGWILIGDEGASRTAKRFDSKDNSFESRRPQLIVDFTPPPLFACCLPGGTCVLLTPTDCSAVGGTSFDESAECEGDGDGDGLDELCGDECPADPGKMTPGVCGCLVPDVDSDNDGTLDCEDQCPNDPGKIVPGICGCGVADADSDGDGTADCVDACPTDPAKVAPGICGCGVSDVDTDGDGEADCVDQCPGIDDAVFAPECVDAIPAVSDWGLVITALLLLIVGKVYFGRRTSVGRPV